MDYDSVVDNLAGGYGERLKYYIICLCTYIFLYSKAGVAGYDRRLEMKDTRRIIVRKFSRGSIKMVCLLEGDKRLFIVVRMQMGTVGRPFVFNLVGDPNPCPAVR